MHSKGCLMLLGFCMWPWLTKGCNPLLSQYIKRACPFVGRQLPIQTKLMAKLILALKGMLLLRNYYLLSSFLLCRKCCFNQLYYLVNFRCCHSVRTKSLHMDMSSQCLMALSTKSYLFKSYLSLPATASIEFCAEYTEQAHILACTVASFLLTWTGSLWNINQTRHCPSVKCLEVAGLLKLKQAENGNSMASHPVLCPGLNLQSY